MVLANSLKRYPVSLNFRIYTNLQARIRAFQRLNRVQQIKNRDVFLWVFNVAKTPRFSLLKLRKKLKKKQILRFERRTAPKMNLRVYSLYSAIMRHGKATKANNIISKVIILLTENTVERSGCSVLNSVLHFLEPAIGVLVYRRGLNLYKMPIPLWPSKKMFFAAKFLVRGARRRQVVSRVSFIVALYMETFDVYLRKQDCFTLKIWKRYQKTLKSLQSQAWRVKKKNF